jgi:hypothetical protein
MHKSPRACRKISALEPKAAPPLPRIAYLPLKSNCFFGSGAGRRSAQEQRHKRTRRQKNGLDFAAQYATILLILFACETHALGLTAEGRISIYHSVVLFKK